MKRMEITQINSNLKIEIRKNCDSINIYKKLK